MLTLVVLDSPAESATKFIINISDSESDSDANSFVSARSASSTSSSCYATPIHSVGSLYHRAPHGKESDKSRQATADVSNFSDEQPLLLILNALS
jgi:hypothetical protein